MFLRHGMTSDWCVSCFVYMFVVHGPGGLSLRGVDAWRPPQVCVPRLWLQARLGTRRCNFCIPLNNVRLGVCFRSLPRVSNAFNEAPRRNQIIEQRTCFRICVAIIPSVLVVWKFIFVKHSQRTALGSSMIERLESCSFPDSLQA